MKATVSFDVVSCLDENPTIWVVSIAISIIGVVSIDIDQIADVLERQVHRTLLIAVGVYHISTSQHTDVKQTSGDEVKEPQDGGAELEN